MGPIDYRDSRPIYEQIKDSIRRLIFSGAMSEGDQLPSVRNLAAQLSINPNTIQRAYRELEAEGCVTSVPGKGSFVRKTDSIEADRRRELFSKLDEATSALYHIGVSLEEILAHLRAQKEGENHDSSI